MNKNTVKLLHKNGIEVILDVVFNHTAYGNEKGTIISYRGIVIDIAKTPIQRVRILCGRRFFMMCNAC